ncbi:thioredoxin family protein [candidate division KSB1 bacterium]|nr:thioredoxin family protein [candidate division KSB1 bacterium]
MGKELLFAALKNQKTARVPWVPFVGVHGGALIGADATQYSQSADLMVKGIQTAVAQYRPDGIPVGFDLQIEAEALGCELVWAKDNPPAVTTHVLDTRTLEELPVIHEQSGRIPIILETTRRLKQVLPDVALYGLVTGPFTLALHLQGTQIFMDMFDNPEKVKRLMEYTTQIATRVAQMYIAAGCDIIALVDPMTSQISPEAFHEFVSSSATTIFTEVRRQGAFSSFFVCGHAQRNVEEMCLTRPDNISIDENIALNYVKEVCQKYHISFGGNLQLTVVLLMGDERAAERNALECLDIGGDTGFILAPGCDLPYAVPPKNLLAITELVHDPYKRQVARELLQQQEEVKVDLNMLDYGLAEKVIVDVITLDSEACAPCQYMVEAVKTVAPHFGDLVEWREHKIKEKASVEFMIALMVKNIPTIVIDGQIKFVSIIPSREELIRAIQERINEKFRLYLKTRQNAIMVLDEGCEKSQLVLDHVTKAIKELGSSVELIHLKDKSKFAEYGISKGPAVVVERRQIKTVGRVPSVEVVKEWLKDLV